MRKLFIEIIKLAALGLDLLGPGARHLYYHKLGDEEWLEVIL